MAKERVQKLMAAAGLGSRRACEKTIEEGRVKVNGKVIHLGDQAEFGVDDIRVDGRIISQPKRHVYIMLNKPKGYISDVDPNHPSPTVFDLVGGQTSLFAVGRLDLDSEGLILLTNDGEMANRLTHPRYGHEKEYEVYVIHRPDDKQLEIWRRGVVLEDGTRTLPAKVEVMSISGTGAWLKIIMHEGKKRQIRKVGATIGLPVSKLIRVRIGPLTLGNLKTGEWRALTEKEIAGLQEYINSRKSAKFEHSHPKMKKPTRPPK